MHMRNGLAFGSSISAHIVSKLEISKSERREQVSEFLQYSTNPPSIALDNALFYQNLVLCFSVLCGEEKLSTSNYHSLIVFFTTEK